MGLVTGLPVDTKICICSSLSISGIKNTVFLLVLVELVDSMDVETDEYGGPTVCLLKKKSTYKWISVVQTLTVQRSIVVLLPPFQS